MGKSCTTLSFLRKGFSEEWDPTVEDCYTARTPIDGFGACDVTIVDTAGQEEYRGLWGGSYLFFRGEKAGPGRQARPNRRASADSRAHSRTDTTDSQIKDGDGFIFVFDTTNRASLEQLPSFIHQVRKVKLGNPKASTAHTPENNPFPFIVLGNKTDLQEFRQISTQEGLNFARAGGGLFMETSAKLHANVDNAFHLLIKSVLKGRALDTRHRRTGSNGSGHGRTPFSPNIHLVETFDEKAAAAASVGGGGHQKERGFQLARENSEFEDSHGTKCCIVS